jgi:dihydroorotase
LRLPGFLAFALLAQPPQYDLILKGGHVIDPKNGVDGIEDVAVTGDRIAAVAANLPSSTR